MGPPVLFSSSRSDSVKWGSDLSCHAGHVQGSNKASMTQQ